MLKGNLSTRPFYNDRLVTLVLALAAGGVLALSAFNYTQVRALSSARAGLSAQIDASEQARDAIRSRVAALKGSIDLAGLKQLALNVDEANGLIDQRTFSWTLFFGVIEKTLPYEARLVAVAPKVERGVMRVAITVHAQSLDAIEAFVKALDGTGVFVTAVASAIQHNDDGSETALVEAVYQAAREAPAGPGSRAGKGRP